MAAAAVVHDNAAAAQPEIVYSDLGAATTTLTTNTDTEYNTQSYPEPIVNGHSTDVGSISITWEEIYQFYTGWPCCQPLLLLQNRRFELRSYHNFLLFAYLFFCANKSVWFNMGVIIIPKL